MLNWIRMDIWKGFYAKKRITKSIFCLLEIELARVSCFAFHQPEI